MQFKNGTHVYTADNQDVGDVSRVVLDPQTKTVTHIVVRQGLLFTEDKVIPVQLVASAADDRVDLRSSADELPEFPPFEETYYLPADRDNPAYSYTDEAVPSYIGYPPIGTAWWGYPGYLGYGALTPEAGAVNTKVEQNIPDNTIGLNEGAQVITVDDEKVGEVSRVIVDGGSKRATHIVVSQGWLLKERKLIPTSWIREFRENTVRLGIEKAQFEHLRRFEE